MIYFDGVALETIAPVKVEDIRVSPISMGATARQRPIRWGQEFVRMTGGARTVTITFALLTNDRTQRERQLMSITNWARSDNPKKLSLPFRDNMYLECICTQLPEPSTRQWWESRLNITFTTMDNPYWNSIMEKTANCDTTFYVGGNAPPLMQIERTLSASATNQSYSDGTDTMTFSAIPAGKLTIDLNRQTADVDGTSIMPQYTFESNFILPKVGAQTVTGTGTVRWRERWE
jgi:phage-related protein